ncbi:MAG TPA: hypothetical protein VK760_09185 [Candidatus Acidoferrales bacterium]|jgi:hypothetical protein|nr:hypothetical protein [Candidatus Acidoferrales bacterium]
MNRDVIDWNAIENFIGYGNPKAAVVFIGLEEGLDSEESLEKELQLRSTFAPVVDVEQAFEGAPWQRKLFDPEHTVSQRTWRPMCDLMLRRGGDPAPTLAQRNHYQATRLGRTGGDTLLAELLPYPNVSVASWPYEKYGRFKSREDYADALIGSRIKLLRDAIAHPVRQLVVCYGKGQWDNYKKLFPDVRWRTEGAFETGTSNGTRIVLTPHFSQREFNTDLQLADFAKIALASTP